MVASAFRSAAAVVAAVFLLSACISEDEEEKKGLTVNSFTASGGATTTTGNLLVRVGDNIDLQWSVAGNDAYHVDVAVSVDASYSSADRQVLSRNCNSPLATCTGSGSGAFTYATSGQYDSYLTARAGYLVARFCDALSEHCVVRTLPVTFQ